MNGIDRLRAALAATGPPPDARELSEMLWLACHITPVAEDETSPAPPPARPRADPEEPGEVPEPPPAAVPPEPAPEPLTGLHPRPGPGAEPAGSAAEVLVPTAPMLADALGVQRALRPLKRRVPSRHRRELEEEATAARIADTGLWAPVLVPSSERWLTLSLVVDTGPTMRLWRPLARELTETLIRQGAFQDVHVAYLDATGRIASAPGAPPQDPGTLLDASGRHAVLVLSDCSGPHWWSGQAPRTVRRWAQAGPTAILQPLAERLWRRTAAPAVPGLAALPRPGAANTALRFTPHDGAMPPGVPVPVMEAAPRWFAAWARLVSGSGPQPAAVAALPARPSGSAPVGRERELPIGERVRRFLATASPGAAELAAHVAVSDPSLPVMRLIQHRVLGGSGPGQLAEVLLSGLLRPAGDVRYAFVPGAREALLDTLPRPEALHTRRVLEAVSAEIERRAGTAAETFRALLPADGGPVTLTADTDHFALVTPETRTHLAPGSAPAPDSSPAPDSNRAPAPDLLELFGASPDELIDRHWHGPSRKTLIGAAGDGGWFSLDILSGRPDLPHGLVTGPPADRDALLRVIVAGLVLTHSPELVNLGFVNFSRWDTFDHLADLPHLALSTSESTPLPALLDGLPQTLETERRRREAVLREAGVRTWDAYQTEFARGRPLPPLPALVVIVQDADDLFGHDLPEAMARLCELGADQGLRFVFSMAHADAAFFPWAADLATWQADMGEHRMSMKLPTGSHFHQDFRPARLSSDDADSIVEAVRRRAPRVDRLHLPADPVAPPQPPAPEAPPRFDVLRLNGGGPSGMFHETWALPASEPRSPGIGYDESGDVVTLYPLDISAGIPHGMIVGDTEARRRVMRAITFSLAAAYSPSDLTFAFAGLGEHPLGEPLDLPHVRYSDEELLGSADRLRRFTGFLSNEMEARSARAVADPPGLVVFADVSLTFPAGRPEAAEALLTVAQKGAALGVQLLVGSATVEDTTIWDRFLPLLGWRVAASEQPPAVLQRVLGRASLPFAGERTAYLRAGSGAPRRFSVADEPPAPAVEDFVRRTRERAALPATARTPLADPVPPLDDFPPDGHLVFCGRFGEEMLTTARWYGSRRASQGALPHGNVTATSWRMLVGQDSGERDTPVPRLFRESAGGVLVVEDAGELVTAEGGPLAMAAIEVIARMAADRADPLIVLCGPAPAMRALLTLLPPGTADGFRMVAPAEWGGDAGSLPEHLPRGELAMASHGRIPIGVEDGTQAPAVLAFRELPHFSVVGPPGSGKTNVLYLVFDALSTGGEEPYVIDPSGGLNDLDFRLGGPPRVSTGEYAATTSQARSLIGGLLGRLERSPAAEFYLLVDDHDLLDRGLFLPLGPHLGEGRLHLVVARTETRSSAGTDSLLDELHPEVCAALLMGGPSPAERVPGRGVLTQGYESRFVQVASVR
ncbi:FtsK/SpoIIIE family protein [Actinomadura meyerae]|uniref:FtsK/SpoIIIE family protein n=1 Tax=Actinomadura meyerae TaxID=240840 RepID=A0A239FTD7_9ACTN|nr:SAV_2336 N-terminal domain-related protein [Actinomadura meyerae]SNS59808.1 FtsK/SpoIIIE family protein [Actinomadura meyerae]